MTWPYPGDGPLARAKRVAHAYRARLQLADPAACEELDRLMAQWGQRWAIPVTHRFHEDQWISAADAAELGCVEPATLRQWRLRGRLTGRSTGPRSWEYRAGDVLDLAAKARDRRRKGLA